MRIGPIRFNRPFMTGRELEYIQKAHELGHLAGDGEFTALCNDWLEKKSATSKALLTHSCTAALEMAAILADVKKGDEIIMPSYTFVSTANAFALRGAVPVFVDIRDDTLNIDEKLIENAITKRTRAIVPVHYAGVACDMDEIQRIAKKHDLVVIEDAAQALLSSFKGRPLGSIGDIGTISFHETKNVISGEGGALLINNPDYRERAEIIREKGTNRKRFFRGEVDKYSWVDIGSSYLPGELTAAFLWAQLENAEEITRRRLEIWETYHLGLESLEKQGLIRRPTVPNDCMHNGHMYYILLRSSAFRDEFISRMKSKGIHCVFHYVPLHSSEMGTQLCRVSGSMTNTDTLSGRLVRLPFWLGLESRQEEVIAEIEKAVL